MRTSDASRTADAPPEAPADCVLCPRLADYLTETRRDHPDWFNAPVPSFGDDQARLLIVGLAPGLKGANRTGRPFTGDFAGDLLYTTLTDFGFASGGYDRRPDDGLRLSDCMITNAVRCVPPANKPTGPEIATCRRFLTARIAALPKLRSILALGRIAHDSVLSALDCRRAAHPFAHAAAHDLGNGLTLHDSYHCSRYNTNTRRLTEPMFRAVFETISDRLAGNDRRAVSPSPA